MNDRSRRISRRSANAVLAGAIAWPLGAGAQAAANDAVKNACVELLAIFEDQKSISEIGMACVKAIGDESVTPVQLATGIVRSMSCDDDALKKPEALRRRISDHVRAEFSEGSVLNIDGWILSVTEVRLYALAVLAAANRVYNVENYKPE